MSDPKDKQHRTLIFARQWFHSILFVVHAIHTQKKRKTKCAAGHTHAPHLGLQRVRGKRTKNRVYAAMLP